VNQPEYRRGGTGAKGIPMCMYRLGGSGFEWILNMAVTLAKNRRCRPKPETSRQQEAQAQGADTVAVHSKHRAERHDEPHTQARTGTGTRHKRAEQRSEQRATSRSKWRQAAHSARAAAAGAGPRPTPTEHIFLEQMTNERTRTKLKLKA